MESVWNDSISGPAKDWVDSLRSTDPSGTNPTSTEAEVNCAFKRLRSGRACGIDGIPSEVVTNIPSILPIVTLLFSVMLRLAVYPKVFGTALIRAILKPGKPRELPSSLRGIRLICSLASCFGQVVDQRARATWEAGRERFGFRPGVGCLEAIANLLALICLRTIHKRHIFVLWVTFALLLRP